MMVVWYGMVMLVVAAMESSDFTTMLHIYYTKTLEIFIYL